MFGRFKSLITKHRVVSEAIKLHVSVSRLLHEHIQGWRFFSGTAPDTCVVLKMNVLNSSSTGDCKNIRVDLNNGDIKRIRFSSITYTFMKTSSCLHRSDDYCLEVNQAFVVRYSTYVVTMCSVLI